MAEPVGGALSHTTSLAKGQGPGAFSHTDSGLELLLFVVLGIFFFLISNLLLSDDPSGFP